MRVEDPQTRYVVYQNQPNKTAEVVQEEQVIDLKNSNASLSNIENSEENQETKNEKITFKEGLSLFGKGAWNKVKEMGSAIIKHPVKTLAVVGATTAAIAALPLIGISAATGAAAAALVFGGIAIAKTTKDVVETVDDYKDGRYDEVREDLQDLGGDGVDLALSLPFMPKALKQVSRTMKYGTSTIGLNKELINGLKGASSVDDVVREFGKANARINYEQIGNEMGLKVKPELEFRKDLPDNMGASFQPVEGKTYYNENNLSLKNKLKAPSSENALRHELEHFKQFETIAKTKGADGLKAVMSEYYSKGLGDGVDLPKQLEQLEKVNSELSRENWKLFKSKINELEKQLGNMADDMAVNTDKTLNYTGIGDAPQLQETVEWGTLDDMFQRSEINNLKIKNNFSSIENIQKSIANQNVSLSEQGLSPEMVRNMASGDKSAFNQSFWDDVIKQNGGLSTSADDVAKAESYIKASFDRLSENTQLKNEIYKKYGITEDTIRVSQYPYGGANAKDTIQKANLEYYKANLLEQEAYAAGDAYQIISKKDFVADGIMATAVAEETFSEDDRTLLDVLKSLLPWNRKFV